MHLQRIQVPDFRVLKDVDITFEKEFVPRIFPLGSLNGGGKSTLLQLIFVLLHCSSVPDRIVFLKNLLNGFRIYGNVDKRIIAIVEVWDGDKSVKLEFFSYKDSYVRNLLDQDGESETSGKVSDEADDKIEDYDYLKFSLLEEIKEIKNKISANEKVLYEIIDSLQRLTKIQAIKDHQKRSHLATEEVLRLRLFGVEVSNPEDYPLVSPFEYIQSAIQQESIAAQRELAELYGKHKQIEISSKRISNYLQAQKLIYICNYSENENEDKDEVLLCHIDNIDINKAEYFLEELSQKVFLAAPATQVFLFLSKESRKLLFRDLSDDERDTRNSYYLELQSAKSKLPGFFAYDFLAVDLLIESFKAARDRDFRKALETGEYGNNYKELMNDLNLMLTNKKINLNVDFSGINFNLDRDGENIELLPEDLSHGELKRLSIYMWMKYREVENAIILMDELEIAFHPDWQYQIISDLKQWAPNNQYILATHSYELCQALTPSHVKELEPKLLKQEVK